MRRLVWAFAGCTYHIVGNLMSQLTLSNRCMVHMAFQNSIPSFENSVDPDHWGEAQANWSGSTMFLQPHNESISNMKLLYWTGSKSQYDTDFTLSNGYVHCILTVSVLKFPTLVACQKGHIDKQPRTRSDCFWSSMTRVQLFSVCNSEKHFVFQPW